MRRLTVCVLVVLAGFRFATSAQEPAPSQAPPFRVETDVIRMDVSVLDKDRRPVRGLKAEDFTVIENGKAQRIVAVSEIDAADVDPPLPARMRYVVPDVATNDLSDSIGDGRLFAVIIDDRNLPSYETEITMNARSIARDVIDRLGPSDAAAVIYAADTGRSQDFTTDRQKLLAAIDAFQPRAHDPVLPPSSGVVGAAPPVRGDIRQYAPVNADSYCGRLQPAIPKIASVVARMTMVPQQKRKTLIYIGMGVPMSWDPRARCWSLAAMMQDAFTQAQRANIVVHTISPVGSARFNEQYERSVRGPYTPGPTADPRDSPTNREFLQIVAENTGGEAVYTPEKLDSAIATVFDGSAAYYLIGYQTSNGRPDGKFRKVEVKVRRSGANVRTRSGYWTPDPEGRVKNADAPPTSNDLGLAGMMSPAGLPLRGSVIPIARAEPAGSSNTVQMAVVLTPRLPPLRVPVAETLTIIRNIYDADGKASDPVREIVAISLQPTSGEDVRFDVLSRMTMAPGRYQVRFNVQSKLTGSGATLYADVDVPDLARSPISMSGIVLGSIVADASVRSDALKNLVPIAPTTAHEFAPSDKIALFLRLFQGGAADVAPVTLNVRILNLDEKISDDTTKTLPADAFAAGRSADFQMELPLAKLSRGPHLLSTTATLPDGKNVRRDVVFRVR